MKRRRAQAHGAVAVSARVSMFGREISLRGAFRANCAAMRLHLVEIHDLPSCPPSLRDALTDFLAFTVNLGGAYDPVGPLLRRAVARTNARRIVDLCSGAGGPGGGGGGGGGGLGGGGGGRAARTYPQH